MLAVLASLVICASAAGHATIGIAAALSLALFARAARHRHDRHAAAARDDATGGRP